MCLWWGGGRGYVCIGDRINVQKKVEKSKNVNSEIVLSRDA
jgi:hypothetical protein